MKILIFVVDDGKAVYTVNNLSIKNLNGSCLVKGTCSNCALLRVHRYGPENRCIYKKSDEVINFYNK